MKKVFCLILLSIVCLFHSGCNDDWKDDIDFTRIWLIASEKRVHNMSPNPEEHPYNVSCYLIKSLDKNTDWYYDDCNIIGFEYQEGYEYKIKVAIMKVDPYLADSSAEIRLLEVISKEKKQSQGLPILEE